METIGTYKTFKKGWNVWIGSSDKAFVFALYKDDLSVIPIVKTTDRLTSTFVFLKQYKRLADALNGSFLTLNRYEGYPMYFIESWKEQIEDHVLQSTDKGHIYDVKDIGKYLKCDEAVTTYMPVFFHFYCGEPNCPSKWDNGNNGAFWGSEKTFYLSNISIPYLVDNFLNGLNDKGKNLLKEYGKEQFAFLLYSMADYKKFDPYSDASFFLDYPRK